MPGAVLKMLDMVSNKPIVVGFMWLSLESSRTAILFYIERTCVIMDVRKE